MSVRFAFLALLFLATHSMAADDPAGGSLWLTPDQQGQRLLEAGDAAAAARAYTDPRRKAYAKLRAGDYAAAARGFGAFEDSDGQYNRGNALVGAGDLQGALQAYNEALARNPDNRDARHNRDLVEQALKQQEQQKKQQGQQQQPGKGRQPQQGQQPGPDQPSSGDQEPQSSKSGSPRAGHDKSSSGNGEQQQAEARDEAGTGSDSGEERTQDQTAASSSAHEAGLDASRQPAADDAAQARRDVSGVAGNSAAAEPAPATARQAPTGSTDDQARSAPRTEQQLAREQWLRRIPDDPGGLLRRKFMIEHMLRQQGRENQQDQQP